MYLETSIESTANDRHGAEGKPDGYLMGLQVTHATDSSILYQKIQEELCDPQTRELLKYAFVRPEDMPHSVHPVPRPVVVLKPKDVQNFNLAGGDSWGKHPGLEQNILQGINNWKFYLSSYGKKPFRMLP